MYPFTVDYSFVFVSWNSVSDAVLVVVKLFIRQDVRFKEAGYVFAN